MSLCPICGKVYCDHTSEDRGQTSEEMTADLTKEERAAFNDGDIANKIVVAQRVRNIQKRGNQKKK